MRAGGPGALGTVAVELSSIIDRMPIKELPKCACGARLGVWRDGIGLFLDGYVLVPTVEKPEPPDLHLIANIVIALRNPPPYLAESR